MSEITSIPQICSKCGSPIDNFSADPGLWPIWLYRPGCNGEGRAYHQKCVPMPEETEALRADNARLKAEVEAIRSPDSDPCKCWLDSSANKHVCRHCAALQSHKQALEQAMVALNEAFRTVDAYCPGPIQEGSKRAQWIQALAAINAALGKEGK